MTISPATPHRVRVTAAISVVLATWMLAAAAFQLDRRFGTSQQRITIRWADAVGDDARRAAEAAMTLAGGEEVESQKWVYTLMDQSRSRVRQIVQDARVADTAHVDRARFRVELDAPDLPVWLRRALEARLAFPVGVSLALVGVVALWVGRRDVSAAVVDIMVGPHDAVRDTRRVERGSGGYVAWFVALLRAVQDEWDWWAWRAYRPALYLVLALMLGFTAWHGDDLARGWDPWTIGDWLVTYAGGFVRRGLGGEIVFGLSRALEVAPNLAAWAVFVSAFAVFSTAFVLLLRGRRLTFWFLLLCLSPAFLSFTFNNPDTVGRKDVLLLALFAVWAVAARRSAPGLGRIGLFAAAAFALTLMHEMVFFYTPYFVLIAGLAGPQDNPRGRLWRPWLIPATSACAIGLLLTWSGSLQNPAVCEQALAAGAPPSVCEGVISYGHESVLDGVRDFIGALTGAAALSLVSAAGLTLVPPALLLLMSSESARVARASIGIVSFALILSAPLFILALDWGRWLAMHASLMTITCAWLLPTRERLPYRPPFGWRSMVALMTGAIVLVLMFGWSVKHCCRATLVTTFTPFQRIVETWQEFEL